MKHLLTVAGLAALTVGIAGSYFGHVRGAENAGGSPEENLKFFNEKVRPVLAQNCYKCHTDEASGGLRVDSLKDLLAGGDSGAAIVPGKPDASLLISAVQQTGSLKMPPRGKKLNDSEIADLVEWIRRGAAWDAKEATKPVVPELSAVQATGTPGEEFFENKVRPILVNDCSGCHGSRAAGGLEVTSRESMLKGGAHGASIVPGDPGKSLLISAVHQEGDLKMPKGGKLNDEQVADLTSWVKMGAPWPKVTAAMQSNGRVVTDASRHFWSFVSIKMPAVPTPKNAGWAKTDIDRFVLANLERKGLEPAPSADKRTLIRRATLDLIGLPPTPEEVEAFEKDNSPDAFAKVVDRLLASPRYGERWGRHWLDVARYADDDIRGLDPRGRGYMPFDGAYVYRDWVIKAVNDDVPYDQFVTMQLAGDLMSKEPTPDQLKATGFLGGGPWIWDQAEPLQGRADERNERIDAVTRGMLGLTVACARCHDHKYDPVLQKDYYALGGVFASSTYKEYNFAPAEKVKLYLEKFEKKDKQQEAMQNYSKQAAEQLSKALAAQSSAYMVAAWHVTGKPKEKVQEAANNARLDPEVLTRWVEFLGRKQSFYPYLHDWQMLIAQGGTEDQAKYLADSIQQRILDIEIEHQEIEEENDKIKAKAGVPTRRKKDAKPNEFGTYDEFCPGCTLELKVLSPEKANFYTDLFERSLQSDAERGEPGLLVFRGWELARRLGPVEQAYLMSNSGPRNGGMDGNGVPAADGSGKKKSQTDEIYPFVHGFADKPTPTDINIDVRGNPQTHGAVVARAFLTVLSTPDKKPYSQGSGRLELAQDIVQSPLATRVWVNRVWRWHFGSGIVNSPDNFGAVGDPPSNPELLEYLAAHFRQEGMSLKKLHREIMLSATYQQSSHENPKAHEVDPANRFYSHFSVQRLDAEQLRDSMLFVAGDLDTSKVGGPAQPFSLQNHRRTVYAKISRFRIDPFLQEFDFPNPTFTAEQRFSTNVPVQRLYFMNDTFVYSQAEKLAKRVFSQPDDAARIKESYRLLFNRQPTAEELQIGLEFLKTTPEKPGYLVDQEPATAWKQYARILFNSNEFEFLN